MMSTHSGLASSATAQHSCQQRHDCQKTHPGFPSLFKGGLVDHIEGRVHLGQKVQQLCQAACPSTLPAERLNDFLQKVHQEAAGLLAGVQGGCDSGQGLEKLLQVGPRHPRLGQCAMILSDDPSISQELLCLAQPVHKFEVQVQPRGVGPPFHHLIAQADEVGKLQLGEPPALRLQPQLAEEHHDGVLPGQLWGELELALDDLHHPFRAAALRSEVVVLLLFQPGHDLFVHAAEVLVVPADVARVQVGVRGGLLALLLGLQLLAQDLPGHPGVDVVVQRDHVDPNQRGHGNRGAHHEQRGFCQEPL
eukprot:RCo027413